MSPCMNTIAATTTTRSGYTDRQTKRKNERNENENESEQHFRVSFIHDCVCACICECVFHFVRSTVFSVNRVSAKSRHRTCSIYVGYVLFAVVSHFLLIRFFSLLPTFTVMLVISLLRFVMSTQL